MLYTKNYLNQWIFHRIVEEIRGYVSATHSHVPLIYEIR